jgi:hypothetical protein
METFTIIEEKKICYDLPDFHPIEIDRDVLIEKGIDYPITDEIVKCPLYSGHAI